MNTFLYILVIIIYALAAIANANREYRNAGPRLSSLFFRRNYTADYRTEERLKALREAHIYLSPYTNIWKNLRLSNKYCSLLLDRDGVTITGIEKVPPYRKFKVIGSHLHTPEEMWNLMCKYYTYNTYYDGLKELFEKFNASVIETIDGNSASSETTPKPSTSQNNTKINAVENSMEKLDINNCSELELTALPGISIVLAKKAINKRDEIGGFKNIDDFFLFMKLKPHMENQLRSMIKVEKMKNVRHKKFNSERSVDL